MKIDGVEVTAGQVNKIAKALKINRTLALTACDYFAGRRDNGGNLCTLWQICCAHQISDERDLQDAIYNISNNLALIRA